MRAYAIAGDEGAFRELVVRYQRLVKATCFSVLRNDAWSEDAGQAVFLLMHEKAGKLVNHGNLAAWLVTTSKLVSKNMRRSELRHAQEVGVEDDSSQRPHLFDGEVQAAFEKLNKDSQQVLWMRYGEELSFQEVGTSLGISPDAARIRCQRAIEKLRKRLPQSFAALSLSELESSVKDWTRIEVSEGFADKVLQTAAGGVVAGSSVWTVLEGAKQIMKQKTLAFASFSTLAVVLLTAGGVVAGQAIQKKVSEPRKELSFLKTMEGTWDGRLDYANFSDDTMDGLAARAVVEMLPAKNGVSVAMSYPDYQGDAGGKFTMEFDVEKGLVKLSDIPGRHKVTGLGEGSAEATRTLVITGTIREGVHGVLQDVPMRTTVVITPDTLSIRRETREPLQFRNEYRFTRSK